MTSGPLPGTLVTCRTLSWYISDPELHLFSGVVVGVECSPQLCLIGSLPSAVTHVCRGARQRACSFGLGEKWIVYGPSLLRVL